MRSCKISMNEFITIGSTVLFDRHVVTPTSPEGALAHTGEFEMAASLDVLGRLTPHTSPSKNARRISARSTSVRSQNRPPDRTTWLSTTAAASWGQPVVTQVGGTTRLSSSLNLFSMAWSGAMEISAPARFSCSNELAPTTAASLRRAWF